MANSVSYSYQFTDGAHDKCYGYSFLGHVGEVELGASALAGVLYMAIYMLGFGFSIGVQILIARKNGERKYGEIGGIFMQGAFFLLALAAVMFSCVTLLQHIFSAV